MTLDVIRLASQVAQPASMLGLGLGLGSGLGLGLG